MGRVHEVRPHQQHEPVEGGMIGALQQHELEEPLEVRIVHEQVQLFPNCSLNRLELDLARLRRTDGSRDDSGERGERR